MNAWLKLPADSDETTAGFVERLFHDRDGVRGVGGFSLVCGRLRKNGAGGVESLAVVSNRTTHPEAVTWIAGERGEVHGLSNSAFDEPWPKVRMGEDGLTDAIRRSVDMGEGKQDLVQRLLHLLSIDTLPKKKEGENFEAYSTLR